MPAPERPAHLAGAAAVGFWELELGQPGVSSTLAWSPEAHLIAGIAPGAMPISRELFHQLVHPEDREAVTKAMEDAVAARSRYTIVHRLVRPDGAVRLIRETAQPFFDPATGRLLKMVGCAQDITEQQQVETELRHQAARLAGLVTAQQQLATLETEPQDLMRRTAEMAMRLTGADGAAFEMLEHGALVYRAGTGAAAGTSGLRLSLQGSLSGEAVRQGRTLACEDAATDTHVDARACRELNLRSMLVSPLRCGGDISGVLKVFSHKPAHFTKCDSSALELLAESVGSVLQRKQTEQTLKDQEARLRVMADSLPVLIHYVDHTEHYCYANATALRWHEQGLGQFGPEILGRDLLSVHGPDQYARLKPYVDKALAGEVTEFDTAIETPSGQTRHRHVVYAPHTAEDGRVPGFYVLVNDITERKLAEQERARITRALEMLSRCHAALFRLESEQNLLEEVCRIAVEVGGYHMAWVGYAQDDEERTIRPVASAGAEDGYLNEIVLTWREDDPRGQGPGGQAVRTGEAVVCHDLASHPSIHWKDQARARNYRSTICLPLRDRERTFGLLALYSQEVRAVGPDEVRQLQELADNLAFGISGIRGRQDRRRMRNAVLKVAAGVSASTGSHFFKELVSYMTDAVGADVGSVAMALPGNRARTVAMVIDGSIRPNIEYALDGTPCSNLKHQDLCIIGQGVQEQYPEDVFLTQLGLHAYAGTPLQDSAGEVLGIMAVLFREPITNPDLVASTLRIFAARAASELERQQKEAKVRQQASLLDKARDAILVRDLEHHITYWNKSAERLYGWTAGEAVGRKVTDLLYSDLTQFHEIMASIWERGEWIGEINQVNRAGQRVIVEGRWTLVKDDDGNPSSILAINTDITERKKIEAQFLRAQRMESIGTLAGGIAHDLNNVLSPIMMAIDLLKMSTREQATLSLLSTIKLSAKRGADMVQQVLSFARGMDGQRVHIEPRNMLRDLQQIIHDTFPKNILFQSRVPAELPGFSGDPTQVHQVLLNLCVNARDAMPAGGSLEVSVESQMVDDSYATMNPNARPGSYVVFKVVDSGSGIPPEIQEKIFDPFFTTKELGQGTGLGLSTVLAIVKSHGGFIHVYSEPARGSTFKVFFPADGPQSQAASAEQAQDSLPRGHGETVLVVDDEAAVRNVARQTLEAFGYRILTASDGAEAVALYAQHQASIQVVLTDMMMPVMDGPATIQVLMRMNPAVKIIAASGLNANQAVARAVGMGVKHFLPKPYTTQNVLLALKQVISQPAVDAP